MRWVVVCGCWVGGEKNWSWSKVGGDDGTYGTAGLSALRPFCTVLRSLTLACESFLAL